ARHDVCARHGGTNDGGSVYRPCQLYWDARLHNTRPLVCGSRDDGGGRRWVTAYNGNQHPEGEGVHFTGGDFSFWWVVLDSIAVDLTFLKMPGPGDRAFPFLTSDNHTRS